MKLKDMTKLMFAMELEEMLKTKTLDQIRISELCKRCDTTTATFYYYFHDKYELTAWIFLNDFSHEFGDKHPEYSPQKLISITRLFEEKKSFYRSAFDDMSQNSIYKYIMNFNLDIAKDSYSQWTDGKPLTSDQLLAVKYHIYGIMGIFYEWLHDENQLTVEKMNQFLFERTPDFLKEAFAVYPYSSQKLLQKTGKKTRDIKKN